MKRLIKRRAIVKDGQKKYSYIAPRQHQIRRDVCTIITTNRTKKRKRQLVEVEETSTEPTTVKKHEKNTCRHEGCTKWAQKGGVCVKHGAEVTRCRHEGCNNQVQNQGVCQKHGAKKYKYTCTHEGCNNKAQSQGVCFKHGAKKYISTLAGK